MTTNFTSTINSIRDFYRKSDDDSEPLFPESGGLGEMETCLLQEVQKSLAQAMERITSRMSLRHDEHARQLEKLSRQLDGIAAQKASTEEYLDTSTSRGSYRAFDSSWPKDLAPPQMTEDELTVPAERTTDDRAALQKVSVSFAEEDRSGFDSCQAPSISLFDHVARSDLNEIRRLLAKRGDPNETCDSFTYKGKLFTPCSLLPVAVMSGNVDVVRVLVEYGADLSSEYGFAAGNRNMQWRGQSMNAAIALDNLSMLKELVKLKGDPHALSSNNANLVWQSCYFGKVEILRYLISLGVNSNIAAKSQDLVDVSHTPLHSAARMGQENCIQELLSIKAEANTVNEAGLTPLCDAILHCKAGVVRLLVSHGANLTQEKEVADNDMMRKSMSICAGGTGSSDSGSVRKSSKGDVDQFANRNAQETKTSLDLLFAMANPVVVAAAAEGLKKQPDQVKRLSQEHLVSFLSSPGEAPDHILNAIFCKRDVVYWRYQDAAPDEADSALSFRMHITTAHLLKAAVLSCGDVINFMNVASSDCTFAEISEKCRTRQRLEEETLQFLEELAPQTGRKGTLMSSVSVFECVIAGLHNDLQVARAIAKMDPELFVHKSCQAIIEIGWKASRRQALLEVICHVLRMLNFVVIAILLQPSNRAEYGIVYIPFFACAGLVTWVFECVSEVSQVTAFVAGGWFRDYFTDLGNYVDFARIIMDGCILILLAVQRDEAADSIVFLCIFALSTFYKWIKILYALTPFRMFGSSIMPILHTMLDVGPFFTVLMFHILGLMHGYIALCIPEMDIFESVVILYRFTLLSDFSLKQMDGGVEEYFFVVRVLFLVVAFAVSVTLMNTFIAALGNSFNNATSRMEILFQARRAECTLSHMAVREGMNDLSASLAKWAQRKNSDQDENIRPRARFSLRSDDRKNSILWYCCAKESVANP